MYQTNLPMKSYPALFLGMLLFFLPQLVRSQQIITVSPKSGLQGKIYDVNITAVGSNFKQGTTTATLGEGVMITKVTVKSPTLLVLSFSIASDAQSGMRDLVITTGAERLEMLNAFEVFSKTGNFKASLELLPIETINLSDLDPNNPKAAPVLFFVRIYNDGVDRTIRIEVLLNSSKGYLGKIFLRNKPVKANEILQLSNRDFNLFELNGALGNEFLEEVKKRGSFPPDAYTYKLSILDEDNTEIYTDDAGAVVSNPRYNPELISPGNRFDAAVEKIQNPYPLFQWFGQTSTYDFALYKILPNQTAEEATRNIPVFTLKDIAASSLLYPVYAEKLIDQTMYAWQINAKVLSSKGNMNIPSEVFRFMYESGTQQGGGTGGGTEKPKVVQKIMLFPQVTEIEAGKSLQFNAVFLNEDNQAMIDIKPIWSVSPPDKGSISQNGLFTAGNQAAPVAIVIKAGNTTEFQVIEIKTKPITTLSTKDWIVDQMARQLFGLPK